MLIVNSHRNWPGQASFITRLPNDKLTIAFFNHLFLDIYIRRGGTRNVPANSNHPNLRA